MMLKAGISVLDAKFSSLSRFNSLKGLISFVMYKLAKKKREKKFESIPDDLNSHSALTISMSGIASACIRSLSRLSTLVWQFVLRTGVHAHSYPASDGKLCIIN